jgi:hypothetical protein
LTTSPEAAWASFALLTWLLPSAGILMTGYLINIAPAVRNGLFYAMLAAAAISAIAVRYGWGITPMRIPRKKLPGRIVPEAWFRCKRMERIPDQARERAEQQKTQTSVRPGANKTAIHHESCFVRTATT